MRAVVLLAFLAVNLPTGTTISIRLHTPVSSKTAKAGDAFEAVALTVAPGAVVRGTVESVRPAGSDTRAQLVLHFESMAGQKISARLTGIDNVRETVDETGKIDGILPNETISGRLDDGLQKLAGRYAGFASVLSAAKSAVLETADTDIVYAAGTEMEIELLQPAAIEPPDAPHPASLPDAEVLAGEPFRTVAQSPPKPSDITNLILVGTVDSVRGAFTAGGWSEAAGLSSWSKFQTFRAIAEERGYKEAPVSVLMLDGRPPDLVFEKVNNTFARRHHLRIWKRPATFRNLPVWAVAATHDTGITFSDTDRTFIHQIDSQIDRERDKVVSDLVFTGRVQAMQLFARPAVPKDLQNATGDRLDTDTRIAVLLLK